MPSLSSPPQQQQQQQQQRSRTWSPRQHHLAAAAVGVPPLSNNNNNNNNKNPNDEDDNDTKNHCCCHDVVAIMKKKEGGEQQTQDHHDDKKKKNNNNAIVKTTATSNKNDDDNNIKQDDNNNHEKKDDNHKKNEIVDKKKKEDNGDDDDSSSCPLCLEPFAVVDYQYPLDCPTPTCRFSYCSDCLRRFRSSTLDDYDTASDGSKQMKVHLQCPMCRSKYECHSKLGGSVIVDAVLLLRQAKHIQDVMLSMSDSELSASQLSMKHNFIQQTSMEHLQDCFGRLKTYHLLIGKHEHDDEEEEEHDDDHHHHNNKSNRHLLIPPLDWDLWEQYLPETRQEVEQLQQEQLQHNQRSRGGGLISTSTKAGSASSCISSTSTSSMVGGSTSAAVSAAAGATTRTMIDSTTWRDPTLYLGMDELMSTSEQIYVTGLLVSGNVDKLAQGAQILNAVLDVTPSSKQEAANIQHQQQQQQQYSSSATAANNHHHHNGIDTPKNTTTNNNNKNRNKTIVDLQKLRRKYPLPNRMPRCVRLPSHLFFTGANNDPSSNNGCGDNNTGANHHGGGGNRNLNIASRFGFMTGGGNRQPGPVLNFIVPQNNTNNHNNNNNNGRTHKEAKFEHDLERLLGDDEDDEDDDEEEELLLPILASVSGPAGRVGLRKGDIVTHIQGEPVRSQREYHSVLEQHHNHSPQRSSSSNGNSKQQQQAVVVVEDCIQVFVNCDIETATILKSRAERMNKDKVKIYMST